MAIKTMTLTEAGMDRAQESLRMSKTHGTSRCFWLTFPD